MPDHNDMPELGSDPMDEAYLRAEQALDDEAAHEARRARVLAAIAQDAAAPAASAPLARRPIRTYGGWLAAACVAGLSVWTAGQVYRLSPRRQQATPPATQPPAPPLAKTPAPPLAKTPAPPGPLSPPTTLRASPAPVRRRASTTAAPAPVAPPPAEVAPPPPLPIPPVEKPIQAPRPLSLPPIAEPALVPAPATPSPAAPAAVAKAGSVLSEPSKSVAEAVVVTGSRIARRDPAAPPAVISAPLRSRMLDEPSRLRDDAAAGRIADIEALLARGAPVDAADENGETALMKSIQAGQREAAALLRRHGASLDLKDRAGVSARDMATQKNDPALDQALGISPSGATPP